MYSAAAFYIRNNFWFELNMHKPSIRKYWIYICVPNRQNSDIRKLALYTNRSLFSPRHNFSCTVWMCRKWLCKIRNAWGFVLKWMYALRFSFFFVLFLKHDFWYFMKIVYHEHRLLLCVVPQNYKIYSLKIEMMKKKNRYTNKYLCECVLCNIW